MTDTLRNRQDNYLGACGYPSTVVGFNALPALADRGNHGRPIGALSNGWELIEKFAAGATDLAVSTAIPASLWYRQNDGWDTFYLFRFNPAAPAGAGTANGILAFKELGGGIVKGCAWDSVNPPAAPVTFYDLFYAGQVPTTPAPGAKMDDCSDCHTHGYIAPRMKTYNVAMQPRFRWMEKVWAPAAARFAGVERGIDWIVGPKNGAPAGGVYAIEGIWIGGTGRDENRAGAVPPNCQGCHPASWVEPRNAPTYCDAVFNTAFDATGSMRANVRRRFATPGDCRTLFAEIGCPAGTVTAACGAVGGPKGPAVASLPAPEWMNKNIAIAKSGPAGALNEWDTITICWDSLTLGAPQRVLQYRVIAGDSASTGATEPDYTHMTVARPEAVDGRISTTIDTRSAYDPNARGRNFDIHGRLMEDPRRVWFVLGALVDEYGNRTLPHPADTHPLSQWIRASEAEFGACDSSDAGTEEDAAVIHAGDAAMPDASHRCDGGVCGDASAPACGNGICGGGESCSTCPEDCGWCNTCGDGVCGVGENCFSCATDCFCGSQCGNGVCGFGENCSNCSNDCGVCPPTCGDGTCSYYESCTTCALDCGSCGSCGNGSCESGESCSSCAVDCGSCGSCGNGSCESGESCSSCAVDCGSCGSCGDGSCDFDESCTTCEADCGPCGPSCGNGSCDYGESCTTCQVDCGPCGPSCGNGSCDYGESCTTCQADCGPCGPSCGDGSCTGAESCSTCQADCGSCGPSCGDGNCDFGETCAFCQMDCGPCGGGSCADGICSAGEDCSICEADCGECSPTCGDGACEMAEVCICDLDCGPCSPSCGDGLCGEGEDCSTCEPDCGECDPSCGGQPCECEDLEQLPSIAHCGIEETY